MYLYSWPACEAARRQALDPCIQQKLEPTVDASGTTQAQLLHKHIFLYFRVDVIHIRLSLGLLTDKSLDDSLNQDFRLRIWSSVPKDLAYTPACTFTPFFQTAGIDPLILASPRLDFAQKCGASSHTLFVFRASDHFWQAPIAKRAFGFWETRPSHDTTAINIKIMFSAVAGVVIFRARRRREAAMMAILTQDNRQLPQPSSIPNAPNAPARLQTSATGTAWNLLPLGMHYSLFKLGSDETQRKRQEP
ncbi:hypothetical protein B0H14DRAFT_3132838 [Mycena olivaceomarginata]|nr:hypothetical protein B0H14DRAFT_3132838 [Mycena olivaceomarginata]